MNRRRDRLAERLAAAQKMPLGEAMKVFGYPAGAFLDDQELQSRRRKLSMENHPDRGGDPQQMALINNAYETLLNNVGRALNPAAEPVSPPPGGGGDGGFTRGGYDPPVPNYPDDQRQQWVEKVLQLGYVQIIYNEILRQLPMDVVFGGGLEFRPIGSKIQTKRMTPETLRPLLEKFITMDKTLPNCSLLAMRINENWKEAWVTFHLKDTTGAGRDRYQSIRFAAPPTKKPKVEKLPIERVYAIFREHGLSLIGGGTRNSYYGIKGAKYSIKLQPKVIALVAKSDGYETKVRALPYGQLTEEALLPWVQKVASQAR